MTDYCSLNHYNHYRESIAFVRESYIAKVCVIRESFELICKIYAFIRESNSYIRQLLTVLQQSGKNASNNV